MELLYQLSYNGTLPAAASTEALRESKGEGGSYNGITLPQRHYPLPILPQLLILRVCFLQSLQQIQGQRFLL